MKSQAYDFSKVRCHFDDQGNLYVPIDLKFGGEIKPSLKPKEWWYMVLNFAQNVPKDKEKSLWKILVGSAATKHRIKSALLKKKYL